MRSGRIVSLSGGQPFDQDGTAFGHTFEFVVSTAAPMTTAQYMVNGTDRFSAGFNIYRPMNPVAPVTRTLFADQDISTFFLKDAR